MGLVDGVGLDEHGEVDRDGRRPVDDLLADDDAGIGGGRGVDDRDDRDGPGVSATLSRKVSDPVTLAVAAAIGTTTTAGEENDGDRGCDGAAQTHSC